MASIFSTSTATICAASLKRTQACSGQLACDAGDSARIRYSNDFDVGGDRLLEHVCRLGAEGIVSKRADEPYRSGRAKGWLKAKCADRQEFVIAGYVPSTTSPKAIGSLIAAYHDDKGGSCMRAVSVPAIR